MLANHSALHLPSLLAVALCGHSLAAAPPQGPATALVSASPTGAPGDGWSQQPLSVSADGRHIAFRSSASNLVPGGTAGRSHLYVRDRFLGTTVRVTVDSAGQEANAGLQPVDGCQISADGRLVAFQSNATNLVPGDSNGKQDTFVHELATGLTTRVSVSSSGAQAASSTSLWFGVGTSISGDGRYVAFSSWAPNLVAGDTNNAHDIFVHDRLTATTTRVSFTVAGGQHTKDSGYPFLSADGRFVAYTTQTPVKMGSIKRIYDVYVRDRLTGLTTKASIAPNGAQANGDSSAPTVSSDGRYIAFLSNASNLVAGDTNAAADAFVRDTVNGTTRRVAAAGVSNPYLSGDGQSLAFCASDAGLVAGDTNALPDVFVHYLPLGTTTRVSIGNLGEQGNGASGNWGVAINADGTVTVFTSQATNLVPVPSAQTHVYVRG